MAGSNKATKIPMMAMTTNNSTKVKPVRKDLRHMTTPFRKRKRDKRHNSELSRFQDLA
jgi:hypothetical protein